MEREEDQNAGWRQKFAWGALILALFSVLWFVTAALGSKFGLWNWTFGLGKMTMAWGPIVALGAVGLAVLSLVISLAKAPRKRPFMLSLGALLVSGGMLGRLAAIGLQAGGLPPIHDVQTDWNNPIRFSEKLMKAREASGGSNPVLDNPIIKLDASGLERWPGFDGEPVSRAQENNEQDPTKAGEDDKEKLYPPINTLRISRSPAEVFNAARSEVEARGWSIVTMDEGAGIIEATETSGWFGFKDDIAIRIQSDGNAGSILDVRSVSRVGLSDLGANAKRAGNLLRDLARVTGAAGG